MEITQMPDSLSNKIAAGEVVERPASVVKELVENSIDANSTWIKLDLKEAGLSEITLTDDGNGMNETDCERAFLPHATSKIKNEQDLFHVRSLGFRGEALASIASVSRLTMKSSEGEEAGTLLTLEGGKVVKKEKSDARKGTEIRVKDLFFNTPARLKYMKSIHTELGHITDVLNRIALSHPEIRIEAIHNGKGLFKTPGTGDMLQVLSHVYGKKAARSMLPISLSTLDFSIEGYIAKPEVTRASRSYISTIINGRFIRNTALSKAIIRGYHSLLPIGRFPIVVLSIRMDPILVDVNVHPSKLEVRFSKDKELYSVIEEMIRNKFREVALIPEMEQKARPKEKSVQRTLDFGGNGRQEKMPSPEIKEASFLREPQLNMEPRQMPSNTWGNKFETVPANTDQFQEEETFAPLESPSNKEEQFANVSENERVPSMYPIGQLQGTYIMAQNENGLYMIDQHAAQERIKYEFYLKKLGNPKNELQELLLPMTFEFSKQEALFIEQHKEELEQIGIFFESFGNQTYVIRSHPNWFPKGFEEEVIKEMLEQIMTEEKINIASIRNDAAATMSCKRSIKANHYLTQEEMFRLLEELRQTTDPFTCPHGRPIIIHFSTYELEKMFKRVM